MKKRNKIAAAWMIALVMCSAAGWLCVARKSEQTASSTASSGTDVSGDTASYAQEQQIWLQDILADMTLEQKVGQMFLVRCPQEDAPAKAAEYHLGGYVLFAEDFLGKTSVQAARDIQKIQAAAELPLLIGVDEEGGSVNRISCYEAFREQPFASPQQLYRQGGLASIRDDTLEKCDFLQGLGINVNFAPVCDISTDPADYIYARTLGLPARETSEYVRTVVQAMAEKQVASVLKHFPGYGNNTDTHAGIAYDDRPYEIFVQKDLLPFSEGIRAGANMVLVSHTVVKCMDAQMPASLSVPVHQVLRQELGFSGVIITDDLYMKGIQDFTGPEHAAVQAVLAGNDMLCCTDFEVQIPAVVRAVKNGEISEQQIDASVQRILQMKLSLGLLPKAETGEE